MLATMYGEQRIVKEPSRKKELGYRYYHLSTVNAAIPKQVWEMTRFPEELKIYEDVGIAKRILDRGWKIVYEPNAIVHHSDNHTAKDLFKRYFDLGVVWKQLGMWDDTTRTSLFRDGCRLLHRKIKAQEPRKEGGQHWVQSLAQDGTKYAALILGKNEKFLPLSVKKRMSGVHIFS